MAKERQSDAKSHRVGRATLDTGVVTSAYRAAVEITCNQCGRTIAEGELFSRQTRRAPLHAHIQTTAVMTTEPICVTCRPLRLEDVGEGL